MNADDYIKILELEKHPEGGYYKEVYRSPEIFKLKNFESGINTGRNFSTSIYFLLKGDEVSNLHRIKSDEIWHHYIGSPVRIIMLDKEGSTSEHIVGKNISQGEMLQLVIPAGVWFCAEVIDEDSFTIVGCTVSPGFDFEDFELGERQKLISKYPQHRDLIFRFTKS